MVRKQIKTNIEIARLNIPNIFLVGKIAPNCILESNFFAKTSEEVDFKVNELFLYKRDKTEIISL